MRILVLGSGVMGTAITVPLADNGHDVRLAGTHLDAGIIEELHESRLHPRLRAPIPESVRPFTIQQLDEAAAGVEIVILGVNSLGIDWAASTLATFIRPHTPVVMLTKGLYGDGERLMKLPDVLRSGLPDPIRETIPIAAIGGPSIAGELALRRQTCVVLSGEDPALLAALAGTFRTPYYHMWESPDIIGVEVSVGLKNLYALGIGIVQGRLEREGDQENQDAMHNMAAALFAQALLEMAYLVETMGGNRETVFALAGVGDLYVTCQGGRNSRMGRLIGLGMTYEEARSTHMTGETIEGAEIAFAIDETVNRLVSRRELQEARLPVLLNFLDVICRDGAFDPHWGDFFRGTNPAGKSR